LINDFVSAKSLEEKKEEVEVGNEDNAQETGEEKVEEMDVKRNSKFKSSVPSIISVLSI
jgi:hypothetical protein